MLDDLLDFLVLEGGRNPMDAFFFESLSGGGGGTTTSIARLITSSVLFVCCPIFRSVQCG